LSEPSDDVATVVAAWAGGDFVLPSAGTTDVLLCRACSRLGSCRLGLSVERLQDDGSVLSELICSEEHEGGPGVAHGGWVAGILDELVGHVPLLNGQLAVTGTLEVRFVKPVPINEPLVGRATLTSREGTRWMVKADLTLARSGALLATGSGTLVERDPAHFARHRAWLQSQSTPSIDAPAL
jgi:acyl-coenzyme A thioesterase PaaI-like protein